MIAIEPPSINNHEEEPQIVIHKIFPAATSAYSLVALSVMGASFQGLGDFPGGSFESLAKAVSDNGSVVVGYGTTASGQQAFRWTQGEGMVSLGNLPDGSFLQSGASDVSADGTVIVGCGDPVGSGWYTHKGFRWTLAGGMTDIGSLNGSTRYEASGVSADGSVVAGDGGQQAFRWTQSGGIAGLGVLPGRLNSRAVSVSADGSVAVGSSYSLPSWDSEQAFRWTQTGGIVGLGYLSGGASSFANAVSPDGSVIVGTSASSAGYPSFRWNQSTGMVSIGDLPGGQFWSHPFGVSSNGSVIVGTGLTASGNFNCAYIWDAPHGMRALQSVLQTDYGLDLTGWTLTAALGITPDGSVIVGFGTNSSGQQEAFRAVLDVVPKLAISLTATNVTISWSTNFPNFALESVAQLGETWTPVPGVTGYSAKLPINPETNQLFRLRK